MPSPLLFLVALSPSAQAVDDPLFDDPDPPRIESVRRAGRFGLGLGASTTTGGLSVKYWANSLLAIQGVVGAGYRDPRRNRQNDDGWDGALGMSADLLFEVPSFATLPDVEFGAGFGPGVGFQVGSGGAGVALAGVASLEACLLVFPLDLAVEYRPSAWLLPETDVDAFSLSGHIRYYF